MNKEGERGEEAAKGIRKNKEEKRESKNEESRGKTIRRKKKMRENEKG